MQGVVWPPEQAQVRAETEGFVLRVLARDGAIVEPGAPLVELADPVLRADYDAMGSRVQGLEAQRYDLLLRDPSKAINVIEELDRAQAELKRLEERIGYLTVRSKETGQLVLPHSDDMPGSFRQERHDARLRPDLGAQRRSRRRAERERTASCVPATMASKFCCQDGDRRRQRGWSDEVPAATHVLPSAALGERGGGRNRPIPPTRRERVRWSQYSFSISGCKANGCAASANAPGCALTWVYEPLAVQGYRRLRQLFLKNFNPVT